MSAQHTKTPWRANGHFIEENGCIIVSAYSYNHSMKDDETRAGHIVKCVNSHEAQQKTIDELVEALKETIESNCMGCDTRDDCEYSCSEIVNAKRAIATAEEEEK